MRQKPDPTAINTERKILRLKCAHSWEGLQEPRDEMENVVKMSESLKIKPEWSRGTGSPSHASAGDPSTTRPSA